MSTGQNPPGWDDPSPQPRDWGGSGSRPPGGSPGWGDPGPQPGAQQPGWGEPIPQPPPGPQPGWGDPGPQQGAWDGQGQQWAAPGAAAPSPGPVPLRPLGVVDIIDGAFKLLRADVKTILIVVAAVVVPAEIVRGLFFARFLQDAAVLPANVSDPQQLADYLQSSLRGFSLVALITSLLFLLASAAVVRVGAARYRGSEEDVATALQAAGRRLLPVVGMMLLLYLAVLVTTIGAVLAAVLVGLLLGAVSDVLAAIVAFLIVLGALAWVLVSFSLALPAVVLEGAGPLRSLSRSFQLVRGRWWPVFGTLLLTFVVLGIVTVALGFLVAAVAGLFPEEGFALAFVSTVGQILSDLVVLPVFALILLLIYADLRTRKEGLDLQITGGARPEPGPPGWSTGTYPA